MELRHLRCFLAVAQDLHFARAAERLHIEQSPLSRAIKELEEELGVRLFERNTRSTRLTRAGQAFLEHVPRVFAALTQACDSVRAISSGYQRQLRVALSDSISQARPTALLSRCREEEPDTEIRLYEVPLAQLLKGIEADLYDVGFTQSQEVGEALLVVQAWNDPVVVAVPSRHPLLIHKKLPLDEVLRYPLVLCSQDSCEGSSHQLARMLRATELEPIVAEQVASYDLMVTLVAAGYGLGFSTEAHVSMSHHPEIVMRPLAGRTPVLTTYLIRRIGEPSEALHRFVERALVAAPGQATDGALNTSLGSSK